MEARGSLGLPPLSLTLSQASRVFTSCAFWHDRMEPARLSMTPSTESSVKKAICSGRRGAAGGGALRSRSQRARLRTRRHRGLLGLPILDSSAPAEGCRPQHLPQG